MFFTKITELNDGKARHICTRTLRRAVIVHRSTFCHWKQQPRRQQGEARSVIYDKLTLKSKKLPFIISHWVFRLKQSRKQQILWATFKSKQRRSVIYLRFNLTICAKMKFSWKNEKQKSYLTYCFFLDHSSTNVMWSDIMCLRSRYSGLPGNPWTRGTNRCCRITWESWTRRTHGSAREQGRWRRPRQTRWPRTQRSHGTLGTNRCPRRQRRKRCSRTSRASRSQRSWWFVGEKLETVRL